MSNYKYLHFVWFVTLLMTPLTLAQGPSNEIPRDWATVTGHVLDSDGKPVAGATISALPMDVGLSGGTPRRPVTDQDGSYHYSLPAYPGKTRLCAIKEKAGYPDTQGLLFASPGDNMPEVSLTPGGHLDNVDIRLGPPDGILEGFIADAVSGAKVPNARITLHRSEPESMYSTSLGPDGHFLFALPPSPMDVSIEAPGYKPWRYKDSITGLYKIVVLNDEHRDIRIELVPK